MLLGLNAKVRGYKFLQIYSTQLQIEMTPEENVTVQSHALKKMTELEVEVAAPNQALSNERLAQKDIALLELGPPLP
jgi:hypothetical protein